MDRERSPCPSPSASAACEPWGRPGRAGWVAADCRGRHYELTIGDVEDTKMTARIRHGDGDRRLLAYADLAPFVEALFDKLSELLERPVLACCDSPQPDLPGTCRPVRPSWTSISSGPWSTAPIQPWPTYPPASGRRVLTVGWSGARPWPRSASSTTPW